MSDVSKNNGYQVGGNRSGFSDYMVASYATVAEGKVCARDYASDPNTSPRILSYLAEHPMVQVRCKVAVNSNSDVNVFNILAEDEDMQVKLSLLSNPNVTTTIITRVTLQTLQTYSGTDDERQILDAVTANNRTPLWVKRLVAKNTGKVLVGNITH